MSPHPDDVEAKRHAYWQRRCAWYVENMPRWMRPDAIPFVSIHLSMKEMAALIRLYPLRYPDRFRVPDDLKRVEIYINRLLPLFPQGRAFARLGSRSAKDVIWWDDVLAQPLISGQAVLCLLAMSERVRNDLVEDMIAGYGSHIILRPWIDIAMHQEYRCFVRDGRLIGISQYYYHNPVPGMEEDQFSIRSAIINLFSSFKNHTSTSGNFVFDVFVESETRWEWRHWNVTVIETNPWAILTDPCLFTWDELLQAGRMQTGVFRYLLPSGEMRVI